MSSVLNFVIKEVLKNSFGYLAGLSASFMVQQFFVKRGLTNLWGLASKREAVSGDNYEIIMYVTSYAVGLIAMALVNYIIKGMSGGKEA